MELKSKNCQSCGMPLDNAHLHGTERDGSPSIGYCKFCYVEGEFTNPQLTMQGMKTIMRIEMGKRNIGEGAVEKSIRQLPTLKRWKKQLEYC